jgi:uncharacterized protein (TIGR03643 family)
MRNYETSAEDIKLNEVDEKEANSDFLEAIKFQFGISEEQVIEIMRRNMKPSSFKMWRKRVHGRATKHQKMRSSEVNRFHCSLQRQISNNKISKR